MKVDLHFHLEEGPYSLRWLNRTMQALAATERSPAPSGEHFHSRERARRTAAQLAARLDGGCFREDWLDRYLAEGRRRGIGLFGAVDHLYRFKECRAYYERHMLLDGSPVGELQRAWLDSVCVCSIDEFAEFMTKAKRTRPDLLLGIEADYFPGGEGELRRLLDGFGWDYVIGSVHFLDGWGFDNPDTRDRFAGLEPLEAYGRYFDLLERACESGLFELIAHPDNLKVFGFRPADEASLLPSYRSLAARLRHCGVATELNTGLAYRYPVEEMCPSPLLLAALAANDVPVTLSSDAHFPDDIGTLLDEAEAAALAAGYREWTAFANRRAFRVPIVGG